MGHCGALVVSSAKYLIAIAVVRIKASRPFGRSDSHSSIVLVICGRVTVACCLYELSVREFLALFVDIAI